MYRYIYICTCIHIYIYIYIYIYVTLPQGDALRAERSSLYDINFAVAFGRLAPKSHIYIINMCYDS